MKVVIPIIILLASVPLVLADLEILTAGESTDSFVIDLTTPEPELNYSLIPTVNSSDFWDDLDTPLGTWLATYNATYHGLINNASYLSTYNATYDSYAYNFSTETRFGDLSDVSTAGVNNLDMLQYGSGVGWYPLDFLGSINQWTALQTFNGIIAHFTDNQEAQFGSAVGGDWDVKFDGSNLVWTRSTSGNFNIVGSGAMWATFDSSDNNVGFLCDAGASKNSMFAFQEGGTTKWILGNEGVTDNFLIDNAFAFGAGALLEINQTGSVFIPSLGTEPITATSMYVCWDTDGHLFLNETGC